MLTSLNSAVSGLQQYQTGLNVIGNNIANANTTGFKSARTSFEDSFSLTLQSSSDTSDGSGTVNSAQVGTGIATAAITNLYTQGTLSRTGVDSDLAIRGEGFFIVRDPLNGQELATRAGDFKLDNNGYLITNGGLRVQGFSDAGLVSRGDLAINKTGLPSTSDPLANITSFTVERDGKIKVQLSDGTSFVRGQVLLQNFRNPNALIKAGANLYAGISEAGPLGDGSPTSVAPGTAGVGEIQSQSLELSNVDLTAEFANMIITQRAFQANARVVTTSDEVLQEIVGLVR